MWGWASRSYVSLRKTPSQSHITPDATEEIKLDGYRAIAVKVDGSVNLFSRRHKSFNRQYPHIVQALAELPEGTVVDGEIVALDEGRPNFNLLQTFRTAASNIHYFIFDLLVFNDRDLTKLPLVELRKVLKSLKLGSERIRISEQFESSANDMLARADGDLPGPVRLRRAFP